MNFFLKESIEYAQQLNYWDDLYQVYPIAYSEKNREIDKTLWNEIEISYNSNDDVALITNLLKLDIFPVRSPYVAFLRLDHDAIVRNSETVKRLAAEIRKMSLADIYEKCTWPKESNRQIGPMFKHWVYSSEWGFPLLKYAEFRATENDAICIGTDREMQTFANEKLHYYNDKGLDFLARINGRYVIGEAKLLTDYGGYQIAQFNDAIRTIESRANAIKIAILDGVLYIKGNNKLYKSLTGIYSENNIMSALLLRDFLHYIA